jgi:hypothetical protein
VAPMALLLPLPLVELSPLKPKAAASWWLLLKALPLRDSLPGPGGVGVGGWVGVGGM